MNTVMSKLAKTSEYLNTKKKTILVYGELQDKQTNIQRLLWVMISDYKEQLFLSENE